MSNKLFKSAIVSITSMGRKNTIITPFSSITLQSLTNMIETSLIKPFSLNIHRKLSYQLFEKILITRINYLMTINAFLMLSMK